MKILNLKDTAYKYTNVGNAVNEFENTKKHWKELLGNIKVQTPAESMNIMLNGWLLYQTLCSRMFARSGYYQSGEHMDLEISFKIVSDLNIFHLKF